MWYLAYLASLFLSLCNYDHTCHIFQHSPVFVICITNINDTRIHPNTWFCSVFQIYPNKPPKRDKKTFINTFTNKLISISKIHFVRAIVAYIILAQFTTESPFFKTYDKISAYIASKSFIIAMRLVCIF